MQPSRYSIEIWTPAGKLLADLSGRARGRRVILSRNEADSIEWTVDLDVIEKYCRDSNLLVTDLLAVDINEVRVKRGKTVLAAGQIYYAEPSITPTEKTVSIRVSGFLDLFKSRITAPTRTFLGTQSTTIAATLISESQAVDANSNFGVTIGTLATTGTHDHIYQNTVIKDALQDLTRLQQAAFDFEITYDKVFNTYAAIGASRPEVVFEYPGNIKSLRAPIDGTQVANRLYLLGSGAGDAAAVQVQADDASSQLNYKVREKPVILSSVLASGTLQDYGKSLLAANGNPVQVPVIEVNGNMPPYVTDYRIGDYVNVRVAGYQYLSGINALYRVEKIDLSIDDEDNENVRLYLNR